MTSFLKFLLKILVSLFFRVKLVNKHNIPTQGGALVCSNHNGTLDMVFVGYNLKRLVHYMAKQELFKNPLFGSIIKTLGAFPVKRGTGDVSAIKTVFNLLDEEKLVGIFPEGKRVKSLEESKASVKPGTAMIAIKKDVPIVPVAIIGKAKLFSKIKVVFGEPFKLQADQDRKYTSDELTQMSQSIMERVYSLMEEH